MTIPAVSTLNLCKTYKGSSRPALDKLSITIDQGEVYGLLGPNGAGKTTLIHILCGLRSADSGSAFIFDLPVPSRLADVKPQIGLVPQDIALYPGLTVNENLQIFGGLYGMKSGELRPRIVALLRLFGLEAQGRKPLHACSGGMKRCVNLIAGILHRPRLLILDEPTVGIDVQSRQLILNNLREVNSEGCTIIYTSHYMEEAQALCTRVAFVNHGRIIAEGPPNELIQNRGATSLEDIYLTELRS